MSAEQFDEQKASAQKQSLHDLAQEGIVIIDGPTQQEVLQKLQLVPLLENTSTDAIIMPYKTEMAPGYDNPGLGLEEALFSPGVRFETFDIKRNNNGKMRLVFYEEKEQERKTAHTYDEDGWIIKSQGERDALPDDHLFQEVLHFKGNGYLVERKSEQGSKSENHATVTTLAGVYMNRPIEGREEESIPEALNVPKSEFAIEWGDETLDFDISDIRVLETRTNIRNATIEKKFLWRTKDGSLLGITQREFAYYPANHLSAKQLEVIPLQIINNKTLQIHTEIDINKANQFDTNTGILSANFYENQDITWSEDDQGNITLQAIAKYDGPHGARPEIALTQKVDASFEDEGKIRTEIQERKADRIVAISEPKVGKRITIDAITSTRASTDRITMPGSPEDYKKATQTDVQMTDAFEDLYQKQTEAWEEIWQKHDIRLKSDDPEEELALRFCLSQLLMSTHPEVVSGVAAKEAHIAGKPGTYLGHDFWERLAMMHKALEGNPKLQKPLLLFENTLLNAARRKAAKLGKLEKQDAITRGEITEENYDGRYEFSGSAPPWEATIVAEEDEITDGEACPKELYNEIKELVPVMSWRQIIHRSFFVARAIKEYYETSADEEFMENAGYEMIFSTAQFLTSRAQWNETEQRYESRYVEGLNEYAEGIHNNAMINFATIWAAREARKLWEEAKITDEMKKRMRITAQTIKRLEDVEKDMYRPYDRYSRLFLQHDGYEDQRYADLEGKYKDVHQLPDRVLKESSAARKEVIRDYQIIKAIKKEKKQAHTKEDKNKMRRIIERNQNKRIMKDAPRKRLKELYKKLDKDKQQLVLLPHHIKELRVIKQPDIMVMLDLFGPELLTLMDSEDVAKIPGRTIEEKYQRLYAVNQYVYGKQCPGDSSLGGAYLGREAIQASYYKRAMPSSDRSEEDRIKDEKERYEERQKGKALLRTAEKIDLQRRSHGPEKGAHMGNDGAVYSNLVALAGEMRLIEETEDKTSGEKRLEVRNEYYLTEPMLAEGYEEFSFRRGYQGHSLEIYINARENTREIRLLGSEAEIEDANIPVAIRLGSEIIRTKLTKDNRVLSTPYNIEKYRGEILERMKEQQKEKEKSNTTTAVVVYERNVLNQNS